MEHPHAEFLRSIADGERLEDWEWQSCEDDSQWYDDTPPVYSLITHPQFYRVRRKPRTIRIGETPCSEIIKSLKLVVSALEAHQEGVDHDGE